MGDETINRIWIVERKDTNDQIWGGYTLHKCAVIAPTENVARDLMAKAAGMIHGTIDHNPNDRQTDSPYRSPDNVSCKEIELRAVPQVLATQTEP